MSDYGVYKDEMPNTRFPDAEVERLLTGQTPENPEFALLGNFLAAVHVIERTEPSEDRVAMFAANAAAITREHTPDTTTSKPVRRRKALSTLQERLAVVAVAMFVLVGMSGLAIAADAAAPGDTLYGIDRALERIGINDGAAGERIAEAGALADRGQVTAAIAHAASAMEDPAEDDNSTTGSGAATALREAAVSVEGGDGETASEQVRVSVSAMLSEMAELIGDPNLDGAEFGRRVSEMARSIANGNDINDGESLPGRADRSEDREEGRPDHAGPPEDTPGGPPDGVPGAGPPDDVPGGPPDHAGGPPGGGPPDNAPGEGGPPSGSGRP